MSAYYSLSYTNRAVLVDPMGVLCNGYDLVPLGFTYLTDIIFFSGILIIGGHFA